MIDPKNITNFNLSVVELEAHILFWVCAAGKNGVTAAKSLDRLLKSIQASIMFDTACSEMKISALKAMSPFQLIQYVGEEKLPAYLKAAGIGCFNAKAKTFWQLATSNLDLKLCSVDDLEKIKGIGPKTARCFLIHSRPNQQLAGLDVHILRFLADKGYDVPNSTPTGTKYKKIESWFIIEANKAGKDIATFDLEIWNEYRQKNNSTVS